MVEIQIFGTACKIVMVTISQIFRVKQWIQGFQTGKEQGIGGVIQEAQTKWFQTLWLKAHIFFNDKTLMSPLLSTEHDRYTGYTFNSKTN